MSALMRAKPLGEEPTRTPGMASELRQPPVPGKLMLAHGHGPLVPSPKQKGTNWLHAELDAKAMKTSTEARTLINFMVMTHGSGFDDAAATDGQLTDG